MKSRYISIILIAIIVIAGYLFIVCRDSETKHYSSSVNGLSFSYPSTYTLKEKDGRHITLVRTEDLPLPANGEGPQAIIIDVYDNTVTKYTTEGWIRIAKESNLKLGSGTIATTTVSGMPALSFRWSGLYEGTTIALAQPERVYVFSVTYLEMGAPIVQDFVQIRDTV